MVQPGEPEPAEPFSAAERRVLADSLLAADLQDDALRTGYLRLAAWPGGSMLAMSGRPQRDFFVLLSGRVEVVRLRADGSRHIIDMVAAGGPCGAVTAFAPTPRWPADVYAAQAVRAVVVDAQRLQADDPPSPLRQALLLGCARMLAARARHLNAYGELLSRRGLRDRLALYLLRRADGSGLVAGDLSRQELADHLQVSRASMTRELGRMADEHLIRVEGRSFLITDREALKRAAG